VGVTQQIQTRYPKLQGDSITDLLLMLFLSLLHYLQTILCRRSLPLLRCSYRENLGYTFCQSLLSYLHNNSICQKVHGKMSAAFHLSSLNSLGETNHATLGVDCAFKHSLEIIYALFMLSRKWHQCCWIATGLVTILYHRYRRKRHISYCFTGAVCPPPPKHTAGSVCQLTLIGLLDRR
jgi:hypothetical protein